MKSISNMPLCILLLTLALVGGLLPASAWSAGPETGAATPSAASSELAVVRAAQGDTKVQRAGEAQFKKIETKAPLFLMDFLSTARNSKLWWRGSTAGQWSPVPDVTDGSLGESTVAGFAGLERTASANIFVVQVNTGIVRFIKNLAPTQPPSAFTVVTPAARIEVMPADRAADFTVEVGKESRTTVTVLWGRVKVRHLSEQFTVERILTSCQEVDVEIDKEPGEIRWVSSDTMKNLIKRTTIPNTLPTDVPSCERLRTEVIEMPGRVHIPIIPIPVPPPPGCPCPAGSYMNPETNQCACCPPGKLYNDETCGCDCPCPPNYAYDRRSQRCEPCRQGANYDPRTCGCSCPCAAGQFLLPGTGCVPECPRGYTPSYDSSEGMPRQCPVCVKTPTVTPGPCEGDTRCGRCETCVDGTCMRKPCPDNMVRDLRDCQCKPLITTDQPPCQADGDCPACGRCRDGKCVSAITCSQRERLNLQTCQCEPVGTTEQTSPGVTQRPSGCKSSEDCGPGEICRNGKCVARQPKTGGTTDDTFIPPDTGRTRVRIPERTFTPGLGIGTGRGNTTFPSRGTPSQRGSGRR